MKNAVMFLINSIQKLLKLNGMFLNMKISLILMLMMASMILMRIMINMNQKCLIINGIVKLSKVNLNQKFLINNGIIRLLKVNLNQKFLINNGIVVHLKGNIALKCPNTIGIKMLLTMIGKMTLKNLNGMTNGTRMLSKIIIVHLLKLKETIQIHVNELSEINFIKK